MGSGACGLYSGTKGGSQAYAESYHVVSSALNVDKNDPDIYNPSTGYFKNPTAVKLGDAINDNRILVGGHRQEGSLTYVMDKNGDIIIGKRSNPNDIRKRSPHPTLIGGKDPIVQCAGMITFSRGKIVSVNTNSGHYKPNSESLTKVKESLQKLYAKNPDIFSPKSEWRNNK